MENPFYICRQSLTILLAFFVHTFYEYRASALYASASTLLTSQESDQITATFQTKIIHKLSNGGVYIGIRS